MDKWLSHNNVAKMIALLVSIILWAMVHLDSSTPVSPTPVINTRVIDNVKIQVVGFDSDNYVLTELETDKVKLEVRGKLTDITTSFSDYKVRLDLSNVGPGTSSQPLIHELPAGVSLVSMSPSHVKVTIEAKQTKEMPVNIVTKGEPADGLQVGTPIVTDSATVKVKLPESQIPELSRVQGTIDVSGITEAIKGKSVRLTAYDKHGQEMKNAEISPASVEVDIPLIKLYKNVPIEVREVGQLPNQLVVASVESDVKGVAIYGPKDVLERITSYTVTVDLSQFQGTNQTRYTVDLTPPEGSEKIEPSSITITVKVEPPGKRQISNIPITLSDGINPKYEVTITEPTSKSFSLDIVGAQNILDSLKPEDIKLSVDASNLSPGVHTVPVLITLPLHVRLAEPETSLRVTLEVAEKSLSTTGHSSLGNEELSEPNPSGSSDSTPSDEEVGHNSTGNDVNMEVQDSGSNVSTEDEQ